MKEMRDMSDISDINEKNAATDDKATRVIKICMAGFGNVGRRFAELMADKHGELMAEHGVDVRLVAVATRSQGALCDQSGIDWRRALDLYAEHGGFAEDVPAFTRSSVYDLIDECGADLFIELTTQTKDGGEPAASFILRALGRGMDVITANKGPQAWRWNDISAAAARAGRMFLCESAVLNGAPVFDLARECLRGCRFASMRGILNSTSNYVLELIDGGMTYEDAVREAQREGIAEADPSMDMDGWDGAAKITSLANILMDAHATPRDVRIERISGMSGRGTEQARRMGLRMKYVCAAERTDDGVRLSVRPEAVGADDPLYSVSGTSTALTIRTDLAGEITISLKDPGLLQTAYGVYADLLSVIASRA